MDSATRQVLVGFVVALAIGLLLGLERERRKKDTEHHIAAGIRTFALIALAGAMAHHLGPIALAIAGAFVTLGGVASYWRERDHEDPGLTTEVAMVVAFLLGALAMVEPHIAAGVGVVVAVLLASKTRLHRFAQQVLSADELRDGLLLAASALVILPLLPDEAPDPWGVFNLRRLWTLVVLVMAINAVGYVALRAIGPRLGLAITGFTGGFVSSTATIGSMGSRVRATPALLGPCVSAALMSNVATVIQLALVVGALSTTLLRQLALPLAVTGAIAVGAALLASWRSFGRSDFEGDMLPGRPFEPMHAIVFAAIVGSALLLSAFIHQRFGDSGVTLALAATGLADTHAAAASAAQMVAGQQLTVESATIACLAAFTANSLTKLVVAATTGGVKFFVRVLPGVVAMNAGFAAFVLGWFG